jgi:biopolymer transport protein ExbD
MAKHSKPSIDENVSPNLVPMIDIMFLLLLFFMLSADMGQRELEEVMLPKAVSVKEDKQNEKETDRLTINIYHLYEVNCGNNKEGRVCREERHWRVGIKGRDFTDPEKLGQMLKKEADRTRGRDPKNPTVSECKVQIRADASSPYGLAQKAMNVCAHAGIYKIEVGAAMPAEEKKRRS